MTKKVIIIKKYLKQIAKMVLTCIRIFWTALTIIFLLYAFSWCRQIIKGLIISFCDIKTFELLKNTFYEYKLTFNYIWYILSFILIITLFFKCIYLENQKKKYINEIKKQDDLSNALFNYINAKDQTCFLLYGSWGIGKSYKIKKFIDDLKAVNYRKIYRISCFGITSREELLKVIQNICEEEDKGYFKKTIDILHNIPIVGELLYSILKKEYNLSELKKGSIFIFDDFERIAIGNLQELEKVNYRSNITPVKYNSTNNEIDEEIYSLEKSINRLEDRDYALSELYILDKYNLITGLINDLQEHFKMRTIIIANIDKIPATFLNEVIISKLACRNYKLNSPISVFESLVENQLESFISIKSENKIVIKDVLNNITEDVNTVWNKAKIDNTRILNSIIFAFISSVEKYNLYDDKDLMNNLFFCILIAHISKEKKLLKYINNIDIGENLLLHCKKFYLVCEMEYEKKIYVYLFNLLNKCHCKHTLRWCGINISLEWIMGVHDSLDDIEELRNKIKNYDNSFAEKYIANDNEAIPTLFEDAMLCIVKNNDKSIDRIKTLLREDKIDLNNFSQIFLRKKMNQFESSIFWLDVLNIENVYKSDNELKDIIFGYIYNKVDEKEIKAIVDSTNSQNFFLWKSSYELFEDLEALNSNN